MGFAVETILIGGPVGCGSQEPVEGFLQEVVGQLPVAGHAGEISPDAARVPVVKAAKGLFVHHEPSLGVNSSGAADIAVG